MSTGGDGENAKGSTNANDIWVATLALLPGIAWPVAILAIFFTIQQPLSELLGRIPTMLDRTDVITMGDIKIEIGDRIAEVPDSRTRDALGRMEAMDVALLMGLPQDRGSLGTCDYPHSEIGIEAKYGKLKELGLVDVAADPEGLEGRKNESLLPSACWDLRVTEIGEQTRAFLVSFLASTFGSAAAPNLAPK